MDYISIVTMAVSVVAILVAVSFAYYAIKFHLNIRKSRSAIAMFFLMKRRTIRALSTFVMGVFVLARTWAFNHNHHISRVYRRGCHLRGKEPCRCSGRHIPIDFN